MSDRDLEQVAGALAGLDRVLVVSHYSPDPDAFGSSCGLTHALRESGKTAVCLNQDGAMSHLRYIPGAGEVQSHIPAGAWQAVVVCDCGDARRMGESLEKSLRAIGKLINIDHHISNEGFGDCNLVRSAASSTSEIIYDVLQAAGLPLSAVTAECLLTGITADTGGFRYSSTSARTFAVAELLVGAGAVPQRVAENLYGNRPLAAVRLHADALRHLKLHADGQIVELHVSQKMLQRVGAHPEDCENLVEAGRDIAGVRVSLLIRRDAGIWKISMRSKSERDDVSGVARRFGGGGHRQAAAFRWRKGLQELRALLLPALEELVTAGGGR